MHFSTAIRPYVSREIERSDLAFAASDASRAFWHLERAHVLGQSSTREHVRVHWRMLIWGCRETHVRQIVGQIFRLVGALTKTCLGWVPTGNTGGVNVSPFRSLPVEPELDALIRRARGEALDNENRQ